MDLSVLIINWNTRELTLDCIDSIYKTAEDVTFEVLVVDNGSTDGSKEAIRERFPEVRIIENHRNLGFARACNRGIDVAQGRYVLLLNSDTVLTPSALKALVEYMNGHPEVAICGPQLLNPDGTLQNSIANIPTLATELLNKSLLRRLFPRRYPGKEHRVEAPMEVESIIGACMMIRKSALDEVGSLDEDYFFFLEETDLCLRMHRRGWKVVFNPQIKVYHLQGASAKKVNIRARLEYWRSRYIFFEKHRSPSERALLKAGLILRAMVNWAFYLLVNVATLFSSTKLRDKFKLYSTILSWHLKGCPAGWGLEGKR